MSNNDRETRHQDEVHSRNQVDDLAQLTHTTLNLDDKAKAAEAQNAYFGLIPRPLSFQRKPVASAATCPTPSSPSTSAENQGATGVAPIFATTQDTALDRTSSVRAAAPAGPQQSVTYQDGRVFLGSVTDSGQPAEGKLTYPGGNIFTGRFRNGQPSRGIMRINDAGGYNGEFDGHFVTGVPEHGTLRFDDGETFTGYVTPEWRFKHGTHRLSDGKVESYKGTWSLDDNGDVAGFDGVTHYNDGVVYEGSFRNGERKEGIVRYPSGLSFTGTFEQDVCKKGIHMHTDGWKFEGEYDANGNRKKGVYNYKDGRVFEGFFEGMNPLEGKQTWPDGMVFKGKYKGGRRHEGTIWYTDGSVFTGTFCEEGSKRKKGLLTEANGNSFYGTWVNNRRGIGIRKWTSENNEKCSVEGEFNEEGLIKQGTKGRLITPQSTFVGTFDEDGVRKEGVFQGTNGSTFEGTFWDDGSWKEGVARWISGGVFKGVFSIEQGNWNGIYKYADGDVFEGTWINRQKASGRLDFAKGGYYDGKFSSTGGYTDGTLQMANGTCYNVNNGKQKYNSKLTEYVQYQRSLNRGRGMVDGGTAQRVRGEINNMVDTSMFWQRYNNC
jgi:hypothetical protein